MLLDEWQKTPLAGEGSERIAAHLPELGVVRFSGSDVLSFLQGYLTVDTVDLEPDHPRLTALTNLQGRVVADGWCIRHADDTVDWIIHRSLVEPVDAFMARYLAFSRSALSPLQDDHLIVGLIGPDGPPSVQLIETTGSLQALVDRYARGTADRWLAGCIDARIGVISESTSESFLPQMLGLVDAGAVDFDKGCYLGQEVVARAQHRGEVKRGLVRLAGSGPVLHAGDALTDADDRPRGTVITAAATPTGQHCLAVVRLPAADAYHAGGWVLSPF